MGNKFSLWTVISNDTGETVIEAGTMVQCAEAMHMNVRSAYRAKFDVDHGLNHKWTFIPAAEPVRIEPPESAPVQHRKLPLPGIGPVHAQIAAPVKIRGKRTVYDNPDLMSLCAREAKARGISYGTLMGMFNERGIKPEEFFATTMIQAEKKRVGRKRDCRSRKTEIKTCVVCGNEFLGDKRAKTCGQSCSAELAETRQARYLAQKAAENPERICAICGKPFRPFRGAVTCEDMGCRYQLKLRNDARAREKAKAQRAEQKRKKLEAINNVQLPGSLR